MRAPKLSSSEFNKILAEIVGIHVDAVLEIKQIEIDGNKSDNRTIKRQVDSYGCIHYNGIPYFVGEQFSNKVIDIIHVTEKVIHLRKDGKQKELSVDKHLQEFKPSNVKKFRGNTQNPLRRLYKWIQFRLTCLCDSPTQKAINQIQKLNIPMATNAREKTDALFKHVNSSTYRKQKPNGAPAQPKPKTELL